MVKAEQASKFLDRESANLFPTSFTQASICKSLLPLLHGKDTVFNSVRDDKALNEDRPGLSQPVYSIKRLSLDRLRPSKVEGDNVVGARQVQSNTCI